MDRFASICRTGSNKYALLVTRMFFACVLGVCFAGGAPGQTKPVRLEYGFETGKVYHYRVVALFSGQIPKLSEPGSDAHIKAELYYSAKILKKDAAGTSVSFTVEAESLSFLTKEPGPDGKISPDDELPFPLPLAQVQGFLNVTALLKNNGAIASVSGGDNGPIKIDVGVDLRKLFILMLPVVFTDSAVHPDSTWSFDEGFLGKKAGRTTYTGKLDGSRKVGEKTIFTVSQVGKSTVSDHIDKEGNSTADAKVQVGTITGEVSAAGSMQFAADRNVGSALYLGLLQSGTMQLNVVLKRDMPDADHAGQRLVDPITVHGKMSVQLQAGPPKTDASGALLAPPAGK